MNLGIIGFNEGNGHPFSFSAIINGYNREGFIQAGWPVILDYLEKQGKEAFDFEGVEVSHVWTQDPLISKAIAAASNIAQVVEKPSDMLTEIDALIIARDDYETHYPLAKPFLDKGIPVFIDKPLSLDSHELAYFEDFLASGLLMSTSGMRYAKELDSLRNNPEQLGELKLIEGVVLNNLEKYGIHLLDAVSGLGLGPVESIRRLAAPFESYRLQLTKDLQFNLSCLGSVAKTFHLSFYGSKAHLHYDLHDNFSAFKASLKQFVQMVQTKKAPIAVAETLATMRLIFAAKNLKVDEEYRCSN